MKNFDEIYKKVCIENLKGTKYTTKSIKIKTKKPHIFTISNILKFISALLFSSFILTILILLITPGHSMKVTHPILNLIVITSPVTAPILFSIGKSIENKNNATLKNPNKQINIEFSNTIFDEVRIKELNNIRRKECFMIIVLIILLVLAFSVRSIALFDILFFVIPIYFSISVLFLDNSKKYNQVFKNNIITSLVKNYDINLQFNPTKCISREYYNLAGFEHYDHFHSNDYISGRLDGVIPVQLGDVETTYTYTDSDGHTRTVTAFSGLFSMIKLPKNFPSTITILSDKASSRRIFPDNEKLKIDSIEFEKHFNVFTKDKVVTMQLLTADIMASILDFKTQNSSIFEIVIKDSFAYIRIHCDDMFEANLSKNAFDYDTLYTYYKYLDFICELNKKIFNTIKEKDL